MAMRLMLNGELKHHKLHDCRCTGIARQKYEGERWIGWTEGRRGPPGGVCGACGGEISKKAEPMPEAPEHWTTELARSAGHD